MMKLAGGKTDVDEYVERQKRTFRTIVDQLRGVVKKAAPELREQMKWGHPCYIGEDKVCYISVMTSWVNLGFFQGAKLKDPKRMLEGTGKGMRHIKVRKLGEINTDAFSALVKQATALQPKSTALQSHTLT